VREATRPTPGWGAVASTFKFAARSTAGSTVRRGPKAGSGPIMHRPQRRGKTKRCPMPRTRCTQASRRTPRNRRRLAGCGAAPAIGDSRCERPLSLSGRRVVRNVCLAFQPCVMDTGARTADGLGRHSSSKIWSSSHELFGPVGPTEGAAGQLHGALRSTVVRSQPALQSPRFPADAYVSLPRAQCSRLRPDLLKANSICNHSGIPRYSSLAPFANRTPP
jgi:hypothetical protein